MKQDRCLPHPSIIGPMKRPKIPDDKNPVKKRDPTFIPYAYVDEIDKFLYKALMRTWYNVYMLVPCSQSANMTK